MARIAPFIFWQLLDDNADALAGGKVYTYEAGTSNNKITYTSSDESTPNSNPIILDASGRADVWLDSGTYKFVLKTSDDATVDTVDNITGGSAISGYGLTVFNKTTNTSVTTAYLNSVIECTGTFTLSLLDVASAVGEGGFIFTVKNAGSGVITVNPDGSELIDGVSSKDIQPDGSLNVVLDVDDLAWVTTNENYGTTNTKTMTFTGANTHSGGDSFSGDVDFTGKVSTPDDGELTIASGAITVTGSYHTVDNEADASSDDLVTISGGVDGQKLIIRAANSARAIVVKHNTGNIWLGNGVDFTLSNDSQTLTLIYDDALSKWLESGRGNVVDLLDEDDMSSDSDTQGATQQSIKAYVDSFPLASRILISTTTASNDATIEFTDLTSAYYAYEIVYNNWLPVTDNVLAYYRTSSNNGSSFDSGGSDYHYMTEGAYMNVTTYTSVTSGSNGASSVPIGGISTPGMGNSAVEAASGRLLIINPSNSSDYTYIHNDMMYGSSYGTSSFSKVTSYGVRRSAADVDALQLYMSSGNISTGTFKLYGILGS